VPASSAPVALNLSDLSSQGQMANLLGTSQLQGLGMQQSSLQSLNLLLQQQQRQSQQQQQQENHLSGSGLTR
jgi:hypothetical protein